MYNLFDKSVFKKITVPHPLLNTLFGIQRRDCLRQKATQLGRP